MSTEEKITEKFNSLIQEGQAILHKEDRHPSATDYRRFRTEAMNLTKRVCGEDSDHYQELRRIAEDPQMSHNSYYFKDCFGVVQAAQRDFQGGYLFDLRSLLAAELLGDFIEQAEMLLSEKYFVPAASLAGAVLEDTLRKLCIKGKIPVPDKTKIDKLNADLAKAGAYNKLIQKRITALADIRNNADHGRFKEFKSDDVDDMIKWIKRFSADHLV